ncbi:MAG: hypothetical protein ACLTHQ_03440 [Odoribacter splanchnicus]
MGANIPILPLRMPIPPGRFAVGDTCPRQPDLLHSRNDDNFVKPGDLYELLVWDRGQWYTMGRQVPDTYGLDYEGVPAGHLYWLRDLTEGVEERIFTYEQGKQVWW